VRKSLEAEKEQVVEGNIPRVIEAENKRKIATGYNKLDREMRELKDGARKYSM
jgi:hypothetical protein